VFRLRILMPCLWKPICGEKRISLASSRLRPAMRNTERGHMSDHSGITPEFSRRVPLADLARQDLHAEWTATKAEREALAKRFGIIAVHALRASADVSPLGGGGAMARIALAADVEQRSVVSLENVRQPVEARVTVRYLTEKKAREYEALVEEEGFEAPDED